MRKIFQIVITPIVLLIAFVMHLNDKISDTLDNLGKKTDNSE